MDLVFLYGAAASGKLTTARALSAITNLPVFHNHLIVDALLPLFPFGSAEFVRLREEFWMSTFDAAAKAGRSLIFTFAPERTVADDFPSRVRALVEAEGGRVLFVELAVSADEQERRIENPDRKQFRKLSDLGTLRSLREDDPAGPMSPLPSDLTIDTDTSAPESSAALIRDTFALPVVESASPYPAA
ncbi:phosphotransferase-like protein [Naasia aerilata]|uniref:Shikimate kinase n=1 Tax=Naasia aerilata TaxID=1162966 RepID=A0ABM8GE35_9MICO|nr:hypothetical protein [Naasia aerilata]BDZ46537.1 hypothetical protein GCM10025866_24460 [Naasia aerilata]